MNKNIMYQGSKINFHDQGKGKNVVLLHGYLESLEVFDNFATNLARLARVVCIDLPGHGQSDLINGSCNMELMADAVNEVVSQLELEKITLYGHSMGGYAALAFAEKYPEKLEGFCLFHSTPNPDTDEKRKNRQREINLVKQGKKEIICKTSIPNTFANRNLKKFAHEVERITQIACNTKEEGIIAALESMMARKDQNEMLSQLKVPKVSIIGKEDNIIPYETALEIAEKNNMHSFVLKTSGHMGFIEQRQESLREVFRLLYEC